MIMKHHINVKEVCSILSLVHTPQFLALKITKPHLSIAVIRLFESYSAKNSNLLPPQLLEGLTSLSKFAFNKNQLASMQQGPLGY